MEVNAIKVTKGERLAMSLDKMGIEPEAAPG